MKWKILRVFTFHIEKNFHFRFTSTSKMSENHYVFYRFICTIRSSFWYVVRGIFVSPNGWNNSEFTRKLKFLFYFFCFFFSFSFTFSASCSISIIPYFECIYSIHIMELFQMSKYEGTHTYTQLNEISVKWNGYFSCIRHFMNFTNASIEFDISFYS